MIFAPNYLSFLMLERILNRLSKTAIDVICSEQVPSYCKGDRVASLQSHYECPRDSRIEHTSHLCANSVGQAEGLHALYPAREQQQRVAGLGESPRRLLANARAGARDDDQWLRHDSENVLRSPRLTKNVHSCLYFPPQPRKAYE